MSKSSSPQRRRTARSVARASETFTPAATRARHDGWTPARQVAFIEALAQSGCVEEACRFVGISKQSAYRLRMRTDAQAFRLAWEAALDLGIRCVTGASMGRAINGEEVPHYYQGELVGTHRRYDNKLAMFLMRYRDPLRYAASLDQMVYTGHPEAAALRLAQATNRVMDEGHGFADAEAEPFDAVATPWTTQELTHARAEAQEEALVASDAPLTGTYARRNRIQRKREARAEEARRVERADPAWQARLAEAQRRWDALEPGTRPVSSRPNILMGDYQWSMLLEARYDPARTPAPPLEVKSADAPAAGTPRPDAPAADRPAATPPEGSPAKAAMSSLSLPSARSGPRCTVIGEPAFSPFGRIAGGYTARTAGG